MSLLKQIFSNLIDKHVSFYINKKEDYIYYKIIEYIENTQLYALQCINTKAIFHVQLPGIVFDLDILHALHPIQACYIGIEYANYLKKNSSSDHNEKYEKTIKYNTNNQLKHRYGRYLISHQDRAGYISFIKNSTQQVFSMNPKDIALTKELIEEFDAAQAFYIGLQAGLKLTNPDNSQTKIKRPQLHIVKNQVAPHDQAHK